MWRKYSKSAGDIRREGAGIIAQELSLQQTVLEVTGLLAQYPDRARCIVCEGNLQNSDIFLHRDIPFKHCTRCGHIQTAQEPDEHYEQAASMALGYEGIYPELNQKDYQSRCERIYAPKADWIFESLAETSRKPADLKWCDLGCGAGYFLKSLQNVGCSQIRGLDVDKHNLDIAQKMLDEDVVSLNPYSFDQSIANVEADIYTAFFVLEHIRDTSKVIKALSEKPPGTLFAFSVPVFGFIALMESIIKDHYPRSLDAMMHTQIYTEQSLAFLVEEAGYEMVSEWVFGQDMIDIHRFMNVNLARQYPEKLCRDSMAKIEELIDPMQSAIDRAHFADARHILVVKK